MKDAEIEAAIKKSAEGLQCSNCKAVVSPMKPGWRYNGTNWEHNCAGVIVHGCGYWPAEPIPGFQPKKDHASREPVAMLISKAIVEMGLDQPHGGTVRKLETETGKPWAVAFAKPAMVDGIVRVIGRNYIRVEWETAYRSFPRHGQRVFSTPEDVVKFLRRAFVAHDYHAAMAVPVYQFKRPRKA